MIYKKPKFLIWNKKFDIPKEKQTEMIIDAIAVIISKDILCPLRKRAANLLLKALLPGYTEIIEDCAVVVNRNDPLVIKWAKEVKKSIPVRSFSGDLIKKSPLGMMQGCQTIPTIMPRRTSDELYTKL